MTDDIAAPGKQRLVILATSCIALFLLSFFLRWQYLSGSEEEIPLRADSIKYFTAAYNNWQHDAHSLDPPSAAYAPQTRTDLSPGFPLFLALFFEDPPDSRIIKERVQVAQAVMGSLTCVATLLLAYLCLPLGWSLFVGLLMAINPHHIALSEVMLTETLYTFMLMMGLLIALYGWRRASWLLVFLGMLLLGFSGHVRTIGFVVPCGLLPVMLLRPARGIDRSLAQRFKLGTAAAIALLAVYVAYQSFSASSMQIPSRQDALQREYTELQSPLSYLSNSMRPPKFFVAGESHMVPENLDPELRFLTERPFTDIPADYLLWNCCARWFYVWHFDNVYNGGAEIYPMYASAFEGSRLLGALQGLMRGLHWPLYLLAAAGGLMAVFAYARRPGNGFAAPAFPVALSFFVFIVALSAVHWLPRYTIPIRPLSYVLAVVAIYGLLEWWRARRAVGAGESGSV